MLTRIEKYCEEKLMMFLLVILGDPKNGMRLKFQFSKMQENLRNFSPHLPIFWTNASGQLLNFDSKMIISTLALDFEVSIYMID